MKTADEGQGSGAEASRLEPPRRSVRLWILGAAVGLLLLGGVLFVLARGGTNHVALDSLPRGVTVVEAQAAAYRPTRVYVGTLEPWVEARLGSQLVSAYIDTVLVRPGAPVRRGEVLATLDCRNASAASKSISMQARAVEKTQEAIAKEAARVSGMLRGGFVSPNEVDQKVAESASKEAQLAGLQAQMMGTQLQVADCVLRAPFDGEISERTMDPGGFVRPGVSFLTVVDRRVVRLSADVSEEDFELVAPGTKVQLHLLATGQDLSGTIARRAPSADAQTRTVHIELDVPNDDRRIPVGTTAELRLEVGKLQEATRVPLSSATVRGAKASLFVVRGDVAHPVTVGVLGEEGGSLYLARSLAPGTHVVTEGRAALQEGSRVTEKVEPEAPVAPVAAEPARFEGSATVGEISR